METGATPVLRRELPPDRRVQLHGAGLKRLTRTSRPAWEIFTSSAELRPLNAPMSQPVFPLPMTPPCQPFSPLMGGRTPLPLALSVSAISADLAYAMASKLDRKSTRLNSSH